MKRRKGPGAINSLRSLKNVDMIKVIHDSRVFKSKKESNVDGARRLTLRQTVIQSLNILARGTP